MVHDAHFVREVTKIVRAHLEREVPGLEKIVIFSDGCAAQYKSKIPFSHLSVDPPGVIRCFFGSRHGKNECDAAGGVIKRLVEHDILTGLDDNQPCIIQTAEDMYMHCNINHKKDSGCTHKEAKRSFQIIKEVERSQNGPAKTIAGTRTFHSLKQVQPNILAVRKRSCFCEPCIAESDTSCVNAIPWTIVDLSIGEGTGKIKKAPKSKRHKKTLSKNKGKNPSPPINRYPQDHVHDIRSTDEGDERASFFSGILKEINLCTSYDNLRKYVLDKAQIIDVIELPSYWPNTISDLTKAEIDPIALKLKPTSVSDNLYPLTTVGGGNCIPRAISILVFNNEDGRHEEIRVRVIIEMILYAQEYIEGVGMGGPTEAMQAAQMCQNSGIMFGDTPSLKEIESIF